MACITAGYATNYCDKVGIKTTKFFIGQALHAFIMYCPTRCSTQLLMSPPLTPLAPEQLCVNVTSSLIHILKITQASWRQDLQSGQSANTKKQILQKLPTHRRTGSGKLVLEEGSGESPRAVTNVEKGLALLHSVRFVSQTRQRSRFVPFLLRNSTGLPLRFATLTSVPSKVRSEVLYQGLLS